MWWTKYFDTLNHLGMDHQCDRETDRERRRELQILMSNKVR